MVASRRMGLRERQQRTVERRAQEFLQTTLLPGEQIRGVTFGMSRPKSWVGVEVLLGALAWFATTSYYLVLTDRRLIMLRLGKARSKPSRIEWDEPHTAIAVDRFKRGFWWMLLYMRRVRDGRVIRFRAPRSAFGATDRVNETAETLRDARAHLPG
jgi:hypothetical protein